jgi:starch synthase
MKILISASEVVPFAKTGGLADVAGSLPKAFLSLGHDIRVILPKYKSVDEKKFNLKKVADISVNIKDKETKGAIFKTFLPGTKVIVYLVGNDDYYNRDNLYRDKDKDYEDNVERFTFYSKAVLELLKEIEWQPDVIHCNDWQTGLIPLYLKTIYKDDAFYNKIATIFTIHNLAYQGVFPKDAIEIAGLPWDVFVPEGVEFWGNVNFMKAGLVYSDILNTVSERYSLEIQTADDFGRGLEGVLRYRRDDLYGIINGVDYDEWNPEKDELITTNYSLATIRLKSKNKEALIKENGLPFVKNIPLIGLISRFDDQKGLNIIAEVIEDIMNLDIKFILLGTGDKKYHNMFEDIKKRYPEKIGLNLKFDNKLAHMIYASSDFFLMPSRFEPCGLGQLISFKYGTIPIVRATGGLYDTVEDFDANTNKGTGFVFSGYTGKDLLQTIKRALEVYGNKKSYAKLIINAMTQDFSWENSAKKYINLFQKAIEKKS